MADDVHVDEKVLAKFAQKLAGNEKTIRNRAVKKLRRWLLVRSSKGGFTEEELLKIWKGLHYCMWMADKPLVQEDLAETLSRLLNCFPTLEKSLQFFDVFLKTEAREWFGIDRLRLDKFMMLIRRMYHHILKKLEQNDWPLNHLSTLTDILSSGVVHATNESFPDGLKFHIADLYLAELEKLNSEKTVDVNCIHMLLEPYCLMLSELRNQTLFKHVVKNIFDHLVVNQTRAVFEMEEMEDEDDSDEELQMKTKVLQVDYAALSDRLFELASGETCVARNRNTIYSLVKTLKNLSSGALGNDEYISESEDSLDEMDYEQAAVRLKSFDNNLTSQNKKKRKKAMKGLSASPATKRRKMDSPQKKCFISESLKKQQESLRVKRCQSKGTVLNETKVSKLGKKKQKKLKGKERLLKKNKLKKSPNNLIQLRNNMTTSISTVQKQKNAMVKKRKLADSENTLSSRDSTVASSDTDLKVIEHKKDTVAVVDIRASRGETRTFNDSLLETAGACNNNLTESEKLVKLKKRKRKRKAGGNSKVDRSDCDSRINHRTDTITLSYSPSTSDSNRAQKHEKKKSLSQKVSHENGDVSSNELKTPTNIKQKNKKNSPKTSTPKTSENMEEGDVEIWVPNKKYKREYKEGFKKKMEESLNSENTTMESNSDVPRKKFATFDKMKKSPPAFVRKAMAKIAPHSEPRKRKNEKQDSLKAPGSAPGSGKRKKRVSFIMERNMAQDFKSFKKSLNLSPAVPFDPAVKPDQGILKSPASNSLSPGNKRKKSPKNTNRRASAADFF